MNALFVTGASGLVGRHLLARLGHGEYTKVTALSRGGMPRGYFAVPGAAEIHWLAGDLTTGTAWRSAIEPGDTVIHLAAATGAATPAEHARVNVDGTTALVRACDARGARRFLFVSTIAATWPDDPHYPYAQTKRAAEVIVKASGQAWTILRPTIVLGHGSAVWPKLRALATLPIGVVIGDGTAKIQPVLADDLASMIWDAARRDDLAGQTVELGGPEVLTMAEFLARVRAAIKGGTPPRTFKVPFGALRGALVAANTVLRGRSPVGPGQLTSFVRDGAAAPHPFTTSWQARLSGVDAMIRLSEGHA